MMLFSRGNSREFRLFLLLIVFCAQPSVAEIARVKRIPKDTNTQISSVEPEVAYDCAWVAKDEKGKEQRITLRTAYYVELDSDPQISVCINGLTKWLGNDVSKLRLILAGNMLDLAPVRGPKEQEYVNFRLRIETADSKERKNWAEIINAAKRAEGQVPLTVGTPDRILASRQVVTLGLYPPRTPGVIAGLVLLLVCLVFLGAKSNLLRDSPRGEIPERTKPPLSLGRVQMAWWFYLVVAAYLYLWLITNQSYTPTGSVLALMGISAATGLGGAVVDQEKASGLTNQRAQLEVEQSSVIGRIQEIEAANPAQDSDLAKELQAKKSRLQEIRARLASLPTPTPAISRGIFKDLFADGGGVSFHRFQMIVWSIVLGIVFISSVDRNLAMPDFDAALLGLMGLSSGTYLGFKFPETPK